MSRSSQKSGQIVRGAFSVFNSSGTAVTGLVDANFTKLLQFDGSDSGVPINITEIGHGRYTYTFTPNESGFWVVVIRHVTHNPRGWSDEFDVA